MKYIKTFESFSINEMTETGTEATSTGAKTEVSPEEMKQIEKNMTAKLKNIGEEEKDKMAGEICAFAQKNNLDPEKMGSYKYNLEQFQKNPELSKNIFDLIKGLAKKNESYMTNEELSWQGIKDWVGKWAATLMMKIGLGSTVASAIGLCATADGKTAELLTQAGSEGSTGNWKLAVWAAALIVSVIVMFVGMAKIAKKKGYGYDFTKLKDFKDPDLQK